ncbi:MAG: hypothetical protein WAS33_05740 [Candidatus Promineifilaceae bacterium]
MLPIDLSKTRYKPGKVKAEETGLLFQKRSFAAHLPRRFHERRHTTTNEKSTNFADLRRLRTDFNPRSSAQSAAYFQGRRYERRLNTINKNQQISQITQI